MAKPSRAPSSRPSKAEAALAALDRLVGVWEASDPSGNDAIEGQVVFEWMAGRRFMIQQVNLDGATGIEIIGYDEPSGTLRSHYFDSSGQILRYRYELAGDRIAVMLNMEGRAGQFTGHFAKDGNSFTGRWAWSDNGDRMEYDATMTRVSGGT